jgi:hypothetical protein
MPFRDIGYLSEQSSKPSGAKIIFDFIRELVLSDDSVVRPAGDYNVAGAPVPKLKITHIPVTKRTSSLRG